ncbi:MAG: hypothetical protein NXY57DRAFT_122502 [Lentinula lateritia]|nr:MAG: hypothetical protein NXY57DRAFT_122502 [Lentinula lateritia]
MGFLRKLCPCFNWKSSSPPPPPRSSFQVSEHKPQFTAASPAAASRRPQRSRRHSGARRVRRASVPAGYQPLTSHPTQDQNLSQLSPARPVPLQIRGDIIPSPATSRNRRTVRRRTSEAHIQRYQPGSFGPPIVTTGPPLQEQWINSGTKKKFVYSNADVIWRSNERRVRWGGSRERIFADIAQNEPRTNGRNARNLDIVRGRRHNMAQRSSLRDEGEEEEEENIFNRHHSLQRRPSNPRDPTRIPSAPSLRPIPLPGTSLSTTDMNVFMSPTRNHQSIPFEIHPELRIKYPHEPQPRVHWDILRPPYTTAVQYYLQASPNVIPLDVYSSAANPPLHRIKITIDSPEVKFWMRQWDMIHVNRNVSEPYITVGDVLQAIYEYFHTGLTQDDLASIPFAWRRVLEKARTKRLRSEQMEPGILGGGGEFVRADLLNGNTLFAGLRSNQGSHMWELILSGQTS